MPILRTVTHTGHSIAVTLPKGWIREAERRAGRKVVGFALSVGEDVIVKPVFEERRKEEANENEQT